jgi:hypothetical protein
MMDLETNDWIIERVLIEKNLWVIGKQKKPCFKSIHSHISKIIFVFSLDEDFDELDNYELYSFFVDEIKSHVITRGKVRNPEILNSHGFPWISTNSTDSLGFPGFPEF